MADDPIPLLSVSGTHRQVGRQIGAAQAPTLRRLLARAQGRPPAGHSWADLLRESRPYLEAGRAVFPQYLEEVAGIAEALDVSPEHLFVLMCEELWDKAAWQRGGPRPARGCTDLVARGRATADGTTLVAHTNDLLPETEQDLVLLRVQAQDEPGFLGVSVGGLAYSAGFNAAGISLTGNEVSSNDLRPGVPRLMCVRAVLAARRLEEAMDACLVPRRASNYNNLIADAWGEVYCMEGSATDCEPVYIDGDLLAHANHYASPAMRHFEADRNEVSGSVIRHNRALRLLRENWGQITVEAMQRFLADHANYPGSICKHGLETVTVFSLVIRPEERRAWIGRGRPCQTTWHPHSLDPWVPARG